MAEEGSQNISEEADNSNCDSGSSNNNNNNNNNSKSNPFFSSPFGYSGLPTLDDALIFCALICCALLFLYSFIKYLKAGLKRTEDIKTTEKNNTAVQDRRFRFSRLRRDSGHKAWLSSLDPMDPSEYEDFQDFRDDQDQEDDLVSIHDADRLIQSDISPETVMRDLDPMGTASTNPLKALQCEIKEWLGIGLAAGTSIAFILIFSNLEE